LRKDLLNAMICIMKFFLLLFFLIPIRSFADWSLVHQDDADHYIDYALMSKSGHKTRAWYLQNYAEPQTIKNLQYRSIKNRSEFDCKARKMRILAYALYPDPMGQGRALFNKGEALDWQTIKPKTLNDLYLKSICSKKK
jgi:hypothetical protein